MSTKDILNAKKQLQGQPTATEEHGDPFERATPSWVVGSFDSPPGALGEFCRVIENSFEFNEGGEKFRIVGAINAAQLIMGNNIVSPTLTKVMFNTLVAAPSGTGKGAPMMFVSAIAQALGLQHRYVSSARSSTKQIQISMVKAFGSLVYNVDDNPNHVAAWADPRSQFAEYDGFVRGQATESSPWEITNQILAELREETMKILSEKFITGDSTEKGWVVPRLGYDGEGKAPIDFDAVAKMPNETGRRVKAALELSRYIMDGRVERAKVVNAITMTPENLARFIPAWAENGTAGRTFFVYCESGSARPLFNIPNREIPRSLIREWSPRIPSKPVTAEFADSEGPQMSFDIRTAFYDIKESSNDGTIANVAARCAELAINLATLAAFMDTAARDGVDKIKVGKAHLSWGFLAAKESLKSYREYLSSGEESDGTAHTEFEKIVIAVRKIVEAKSFNGYVSTITTRLKTKKNIMTLVNAMSKPGETVKPEHAIGLVVEAIANSPRSPFMIDGMNPNKLHIMDGGDWEDIYLEGRLFGLMERATAKLRYHLTRKK